jgi:hypothetical protein
VKDAPREASGPKNTVGTLPKDMDWKPTLPQYTKPEVQLAPDTGAGSDPPPRLARASVCKIR